MTDSDLHVLDFKNRSNGNYECAGVVIEDDASIKDNVRFLKGVKVGCGSVVVSDVEYMSVYERLPAINIRALSQK